MIGSCESSLNEDAKIGIGFVSCSITSREKKMLSPNNSGFIDVNQTVLYIIKLTHSFRNLIKRRFYFISLLGFLNMSVHVPCI